MNYQLAQLNIAKFKLPIEDPANADFVNNLDLVNAIAEQQPGFIWRLKGEGNNAMDLQAFDDPNLVVNLSVWSDLESLGAFVYRNSQHLGIMRRRKEWFEKLEFRLVLWWIEAGHQPTVEESKQRLVTLAQNGPCATAFTFRNPFPQPGESVIAPVLDDCA